MTAVQQAPEASPQDSKTFEQATLPPPPDAAEAKMSLEAALEAASLDDIRRVFVSKLVQAMDGLLAQNTDISLTRATDLIKVVESIAGSENDLFRAIPHRETELIPQMDLAGCELINGRINGKARFNSCTVPVLNGSIVKEIDGKPIKGCDRIRNIDYKLNGIINVDGKNLPVISGKVIYEVEGSPVEDCKYIENVGGLLNGVVKLEGRFLPVLNGVVVKSIAGRQITNFEDFENVNGKLNGRMSVKPYGEYVPVIDDELLTHVSEEPVFDCKEIKNVGGKLNGQVSFPTAPYDYFQVKNGYLKPRFK